MGSAVLCRQRRKVARGFGSIEHAVTVEVGCNDVDQARDADEFLRPHVEGSRIGRVSEPRRRLDAVVDIEQGPRSPETLW